MLCMKNSASLLPYTITGITSGPPALEIYGALCLGPNKF
jgi:hypothetical protein